MKPSCLVLVCIFLLVSQISCQRRGYGGRRTHQDIDREESLVSLKKYPIFVNMWLQIVSCFIQLNQSFNSKLRTNNQIDFNDKVDCNFNESRRQCKYSLQNWHDNEFKSGKNLPQFTNHIQKILIIIVYPSNPGSLTRL